MSTVKELLEASKLLSTKMSDIPNDYFIIQEYAKCLRADHLTIQEFIEHLKKFKQCTIIRPINLHEGVSKGAKTSKELGSPIFELLPMKISKLLNLVKEIKLGEEKEEIDCYDMLPG